MAEYGMEIRNSAGKLLLDTDETVLQFKQKFLCTSNGQAFDTGISVSDPIAPSVFTHQPGFCRVYNQSGRWHIMGYTVNWAGQNYRPFEIYVFARPQPTGIWGLRVYKANGELQYQSTSKSISIIDVLSTGEFEINARAYPVGKIATNSMILGETLSYDDGSGEQTYPTCMTYARGNTFYEHDVFSEYGLMPSTIYSQRSTSLIIDVSRFG
ncbi:hypothetical protein ACEUA8_01520 [Aeromonas veronii]